MSGAAPIEAFGRGTPAPSKSSVSETRVCAPVSGKQPGNCPWTNPWLCVPFAPGCVHPCRASSQGIAPGQIHGCVYPLPLAYRSELLVCGAPRRATFVYEITLLHTIGNGQHVVTDLVGQAGNVGIELLVDGSMHGHDEGRARGGDTGLLVVGQSLRFNDLGGPHFWIQPNHGGQPLAQYEGRHTCLGTLSPVVWQCPLAGARPGTRGDKVPRHDGTGPW
jgi:hypothetical protein